RTHVTLGPGIPERLSQSPRRSFWTDFVPDTGRRPKTGGGQRRHAYAVTCGSRQGASFNHAIPHLVQAASTYLVQQVGNEAFMAMNQTQKQMFRADRRVVQGERLVLAKSSHPVHVDGLGRTLGMSLCGVADGGGEV